jgi:hypothetical protein
MDTKTALIIIMGAFVCAVMIVPDIILISNCNSQHEKLAEKIDNFQGEFIKDKIDRMIQEEMEARLEAIDNE